MHKSLAVLAVSLGVFGFAVTPALAMCGHLNTQSVSVEDAVTVSQSTQTIMLITQTAQQPKTAK